MTVVRGGSSHKGGTADDARAGVLEDLPGDSRRFFKRAFVCIAPDNPRALPAHKLARAVRWTGQDLLGCSACVNPYVARSIVDGV